MTTNYAKKVFCKRSGTTHKGDEYEDIITAKLALELAINDDVQDFCLSSNNANFGNFDDVVLEVFYKHQAPRKYAIQLKHKNNDKKTVTKDMLAAEKGNFSIEEYFQSFQKIKQENPELKFLLHTNAKFDFGANPCSFNLEKKKYFQITINKIQPPMKEFLNFSENNYVFQFDIAKNDHESKEGDDEIDEYKQFFKQFFFYPNQKNVDDLKMILKKNFQDTYRCEENPFKMFLDFITNWSKVEGKKLCLEKQVIKFKIVEILLKCMKKMSVLQRSNISIDFSKYHSFKETCLQYDVVIFRTQEEKTIKQIRQVFWEQDTQINEEFLETAKLFCIVQPGKKDLDKIEDEEKMLILWHMNQLPLILHVTEENKMLIQHVIDLCLEENKLKRKFILVGEDINLENLKTVKLFQNLNDLSLDSKFLEKLTEGKQTTLQGREFTTLKTLITDNDEEIKKIITPVEVMKMLDGSLKIGEEKEELPVPYIDQFLLSLQTSIQFLNKSKENVIPVISYSGIIDNEMKKQINAKFISVENYMKYQNTEQFPETVKSYVKDGNDIYFEAQNLIIVTENECSREQFQEICKKNPNNIYHHFHMKPNGKLKWIEGTGNFERLRKTLNFEYLPASVIFETNDNNINIITSKPGMGKSTLLKYLKNNASPDYWIVDVNFREHVNFFKEKRNPLDVINYVLRFQSEKQQYDSLTLETRKIFEKRKKLLFFWDGFDELPAMYWKTTLETIENLVNLDYGNWITTRNNLQKTFEDKFNIFAMTIKNVDEEQQKYYIKKRLESKCAEKEINQITDKILENIRTTGDLEFLGIPLHLSLLTQLFCQNPDKYRELLNSTFTLSEMIGYSIEETFNYCYQNKGSCDLAQPFLKTVFEEHMQWKMLQYELIALKTYLPDDKFSNLHISEDLLKYTKLTTDDFGLITKIDHDTYTAIFVHNIYGEYFVAKWISKNAELIPLIKDIFFSETFNNIRMIFDTMIVKDFPAHLAVLHKNVKALRKYRNQCLWKDKMGRNPLHLACSWGERRPILAVEHEDDKYLIDDSDEDTVISNDNPEQEKIINFLIKRKCDPFEKDNIFHWNCLEYADASLSLYSLEIMCKNGILIELEKLKNFKCIYNVLYYSVKFDYRELFEAVENVPYIEGKQNEENLLHMATFLDRNNYFDKIFKNQKYITDINKQNCEKRVMFRNRLNSENKNKINPVFIMPLKELLPDAFDLYAIVKNNILISYQIFKQTPIHLAAINGNHDAIIKLIDKGTDINIQNNYGHNALHLAIIHNHFNVVKLLIRRGVKTDQTNRNQENILHLAVKTGNLSIIQYLLKKKIKIEENKGQMTPLHYAVVLNNTDIIDLMFDLKIYSKEKLISITFPFALANGYINVAKHLIKTNRITTEYQISCFYVAIIHDSHNVVRFLLENKINVNIRYDEKTPLHVAALCGNISMLDLLLKHGANINLTNNLGQTTLLACMTSNIFKNYDPRYVNNKNINIDETINTIEFLLKNGADSNIPDNMGETPLSCSLCYGNTNLSISEEFVGKKKYTKISIHEPSVPSTERINNESLDFIKLLLENGADANAKNQQGRTLLHLSIIENYTNVYEFLIKNQEKYGIDLDIGDHQGNTALFYAVKNENIELIDLLIKSGINMNTKNIIGCNVLQHSSVKGYLQISQLLLNRGVHVNNEDFNGDTALHLVAYSGRFLNSSAKTWKEAVQEKFILTPEESEKYYNLAKLLIEYKANVNQSNNFRHTPLHYAAFCGNLKIVELLMQESCDLNKSSALSISIFSDSKSVYEYLLNNKEKYSIEINLKDENGNNINLQYAIERQNTDVIKLLSTNGVDVNDRNKNGATVLHLVAADGKPEMVQLFLELGAKTDIRDNDGKTPLHYAARYGHRKIVEILIKHGSIININDNFGDTPLQLAKDAGHKKKAKLLRSRISEH